MDCAEKLITRLDEIEPSIILMDIEMPGITGLVAAGVLRDHQKLTGKKHEVIALTAHNGIDIMSIVAAAGFDDYLQKPISKHDLKTRLSRYFEKESELCISDPMMNKDNGGLKDKLYSLEMFEADDPEFVRSIVEMFVKNTPVTIAEIKAAFEQDDMESLRQHAHKIKPHFSFFGAPHLQQTFQMIEDIAKTSNNKEKLPGLIDCAEKTSFLMTEQMKADLLS
jgi:CheY-like chemotaxis protein